MRSASKGEGVNDLQEVAATRVVIPDAKRCLFYEERSASDCPRIGILARLHGALQSRGSGRKTFFVGEEQSSRKERYGEWKTVTASFGISKVLQNKSGLCSVSNHLAR